MSEKTQKKLKNSFHLRIYDAELLKSLTELAGTGNYESMNELLNCALGIGVEKIYLEFGKRKLFTQPRAVPEVPDSRKLDKTLNELNKMRILQEDMFILLNTLEGLIATLYNTRRADIKGEALNEELYDSGYLATLPDWCREIKDSLVARFNRKFQKENTKKE